MSSASKVNDIDYLLEEVVTLPSLPTTVANITNLVNDPDTSLSSVAKAISADPSIALKSLRLVNSAYYGLRDKVTSVEHAVVLLGMKVVKNMVFTATVFDTLQGGAEELLRHSLATGVAMRILALSPATKNVTLLEADEAFVYGLLHDVGKIIFDQYMPKEYAAVKEVCVERKISWSEAELEVIGVDHAELGGRLAQKWKLTDELVAAIRGHHDLSRCEMPEHRALAGCLAIADYVCYASGMQGQSAAPVKLEEEVWEATGLDAGALPGVLEQFFESAKDVDELVGLAS